jgi:hypothetical protein
MVATCAAGRRQPDSIQVPRIFSKASTEFDGGELFGDGEDTHWPGSPGERTVSLTFEIVGPVKVVIEKDGGTHTRRERGVFGLRSADPSLEAARPGTSI